MLYRFSALGACAVILGSSTSAVAIEKPKDWTVQYVDASCIASTYAPVNGIERPILIKLGFVYQDSSLLIVSFKSPAFRKAISGNGVGALEVGDQSFEVVSFKEIDDEIMIFVDDTQKLQAALNNSKSLGFQYKRADLDKTLHLKVSTNEIPKAFKWAKICAVIGIMSIQ